MNIVVETLKPSLNVTLKLYLQIYLVTVEEIRRRTAPSESMSVNTLTALLRTNKNLKKDLRQQLQGVGVTLAPVTRVTSLCSKLSEGTVQVYTLFL